MTPLLAWLDESNQRSVRYFAPANNQYFINAMKRKWRKRILIAIAIPLVIAFVMALPELIK